MLKKFKNLSFLELILISGILFFIFLFIYAFLKAKSSNITQPIIVEEKVNNKVQVKSTKLKKENIEKPVNFYTGEFKEFKKEEKSWYEKPPYISEEKVQENISESKRIKEEENKKIKVKKFKREAASP